MPVQDPLAWTLLALFGLQRVIEAVRGQRHLAALLRQGARLFPRDGIAGLALVHALFFGAAVAELAFAPWAGRHAATLPLLLIFVAGEVLHAWAVVTLGPRWTTRVVAFPNETLVARGPYRWIRHPNYAGVAVELVALPLAFGLYATAALTIAAGAAALAYRLRVEERALAPLRAG